MNEVTLDITRVGQLGQGVGHDDDGNVYFVDRALPGDRVRARITEIAKKYREAELLEVISPAKERIASPCSHFPQCGGCDWITWDYSAQLKAKFDLLQHLLERHQWKPKEFLPVLPSPKIFHYRNRIQVRSENGKVGFFAKKSHEIVDITECKISDPALNAQLPVLRAQSAAQMTKYELMKTENGEIKTLTNRPHAAEGFVQVNKEQNEQLRRLVKEQVEKVGAKRLLELFCGNGNLSFAFLDSPRKAIDAFLGIDSHPVAIQEASQKVLDRSQYQFKQDTAYHLPRDWRGNYDTLLLDPPRQGFGALRNFLHPDLKAILYVCCAPHQFVRDVSDLRKDWSLEWVQPLDMFPHTRHLEFVARFQRLDMVK